MNAWPAKDFTDTNVSEIGAEEDDLPISKTWTISAGGATVGMVVKITVSDVTVNAGITAKLQTAEGGEWEDSKTVSITEDGNVYIKLLAANSSDQTHFPLLASGRVVITTGASDAVTVDEIRVLQPE